MNTGVVEKSGAARLRHAMKSAWEAMRALPAPGSHYLLPFGGRSRPVQDGFRRAE